MRIWLEPSAEVTLHEQMVRQVTLGVLSGELACGERLPSVRAVARRFHVHSNTVSAAYRQLCREGWVESRHGSGMYVRATAGGYGGLPEEVSELEGLLTQVARSAAELGLSEAEVYGRLARAMDRRHRVVLLEPDAELARLVQFECVAAGCGGLEMCVLPVERWGAEADRVAGGAMVAVLPSKAEAARAALGPGVPLLVLRIRPIAATVADNLPVSREHLVGIASAWPQFLEVAQTLLMATGFSADTLMVRDARVSGWEAGLTAAAAVICDMLTAKRLPPGVQALAFPLIAEGALAELRALGSVAGRE